MLLKPEGPALKPRPSDSTSVFFALSHERERDSTKHVRCEWGQGTDSRDHSEELAAGCSDSLMVGGVEVEVRDRR